MKDILEVIWAGVLIILLIFGAIAAFAALSVFTILEQKEFWYLVIIGVFLYVFI
jgi:hypothetical protein